jgi:ribose transport system substrate-binding protein
MGQNASQEARAELRRPGSRLVGSVAYFPERYGDEVMRLASAILSHQPAPPAVFTKHELLTRSNVDRLYPLDEMASLSASLPR